MGDPGTGGLAARKLGDCACKKKRRLVLRQPGHAAPSIRASSAAFVTALKSLGVRVGSGGASWAISARRCSTSCARFPQPFCASACGPPIQDADALIARLWLSLSGEIDAAKDVQTLAAVLRDFFERFDVTRTAKGALKVRPFLDASAAGRLMRDALDGKPSTVDLHAYSVDDPEDPDAVLAVEVSGPPTLTATNLLRPRT